MNQYKTSEQQRAAARLYYHTYIKNDPHKMQRRRDYSKLYYQNKNKNISYHMIRVRVVQYASAARTKIEHDG